MECKMRTLVVNHINIRRDYEKITHTWGFYEYDAYVYERDTKRFLEICDELKVVKKELIKEIGYWNYFLYSNFFFKSYFFKKFELAWEKD